MSKNYSNIALFYDLATRRALAPVRQRIAELLRHGWSAGADPANSEAVHDSAAPGGSKAQRPNGAQSRAAMPSSPGSPLRVLDIGCGTGVQLEYLSNAGFDCAGVDESPEMLERAALRCAGECVPKPEAANGGSQSENPGGEAEPPARSSQETLKNPAHLLSPGCCLVQAPAGALPFAVNSFDAAILSLILHESETEPHKLLTEAMRVAPRLLVLEWKMPERNLDYLYWLPMYAIERMAGKRHFRHFRNYMRQGALEGMIYCFNQEAEKNGTPRLESAGYEFFRLGSLVLMDLRRVPA